jgi:elongation factor Ts
MQIAATSVKELRERTGAGILECRRALEQTDGDLEKAIVLLQEQGLAKAAKKLDRAVGQGIVEAYLHGSRIGVLVELNCETDFVARTDEFKTLAHDIALQVAAMSPLYVSEAEIPEGSDEDPAEVTLLRQTSIKEPSKTIQDRITETIAKLGENIQVRRFSRFEVGR